MRELRFDYRKYQISPVGKPAQYIYRPVIPVRLVLGRKAVKFVGLIDSGADECTFPGWVANMLGLDVYKGEERLFSGIGGSVLAYLHRTKLSLDGVQFVTDVYYSHSWDDMPFGLLGQASFYSHFDIEFRYRAKEVVLKH